MLKAVPGNEGICGLEGDRFVGAGGPDQVPARIVAEALDMTVALRLQRIHQFLPQPAEASASFRLAESAPGTFNYRQHLRNKFGKVGGHEDDIMDMGVPQSHAPEGLSVAPAPAVM